MIPLRRQALKLALAWLFITFAVAPSTVRADMPETVVDAFHSDLLAVMKDSDNLGVSGRYTKFLEHLDRYFHMPLMVSFVSGTHWAKADQDARRKLNDAARRLSAGELAVLFSGYGGETFKTVGTRPIKDGSVLVETELERQSDSNVKVTYRLRKFGEKWRIIDVLLDGTISQLIKRRDEYRRTLEDSGISGLTDLLNAKADEILASGRTAKAGK
jgi:phospholipid transport system substrate-binding protein